MIVLIGLRKKGKIPKSCQVLSLNISKVKEGGGRIQWLHLATVPTALHPFSIFQTMHHHHHHYYLELSIREQERLD